MERPLGSSVMAMMGSYQRNVGNLDMPTQQRQQPQVRRQTLCRERRRTLVVAKDDVAKADRIGWEDRNADAALDRRVESGRARIWALTASRAASVETRNDDTATAPRPTTTRAANTSPMRLKPMTVVTSTDPECRLGAAEASPRKEEENPFDDRLCRFRGRVLPPSPLRGLTGLYINVCRAAG